MSLVTRDVTSSAAATRLLNSPGSREMATLRPLSRLGFFSLLVGAIAAVVALAKNSPTAAVLSISILLATAEIYLLVKSAGGFTAVLLPLITVNAALTTALVFWHYVQDEAYVAFRITASDDYLIQAALIGMAFCAAYTVGALLAGPRRVIISLAPFQVGASFKLPNGALTLAGYAAVVLAIYGWQGALLESRYLQADGPFWAVAISSSVGIPFGLLALAIAASRGGRWRVVAMVGVGILALILFARASRGIAMVPILIMIARLLTSGKVSPRSAVLAGAMTVVLLQLPFVGRSNPDGVGIVPLGRLLLTRPGEVFTELNPAAIFGNFLYSAPQTATVANRQIPQEAFWVSINPMPGTVAGWDAIKGSLKLNPHTPYNALGELAAHGWVALILFAAVAGFLLALATRIAFNIEGGYQFVASILVLAVAAFFSLSILQYNLRPSARLIWYLLFGLSAVWLAANTVGRRRQVAESGKDLSPALRHARTLDPRGQVSARPGLLTSVPPSQRSRFSGECSTDTAATDQTANR
jgi:hypothetical protein